ncbi:uncharacterized protein LOC114517225 [Dendronephthya gigantea]|uniref:uncharacterized protein LOC114517225 n=1 Tax=Dendronephthya gigantea TaxID=151771 RepID=UPI00106C1FBC|nr:uncharacterized protein LOC114517225 [Dendronephthya gigantea]
MNDHRLLDLDNVLQRVHEINGYTIKISAEDSPIKPVPKRRTKKTQDAMHKDDTKDFQSQQDVEMAHLGKVRTVIVNGLWKETSNEALTMFFESGRRSGGGKIEKLERNEPDVAHITFVSHEVAAQVLKQNKLELDGYLLQLKEKEPELILPLDRNKLKFV